MFKKLDDWLWKLCNKRPPKPCESYMNIIAPWICVGAVSGVFLLPTVIALENGSKYWYIPLIIGIYLVLMLVMMFVTADKKTGVYGAIGKRGREYWEERSCKLGMKSKED